MHEESFRVASTPKVVSERFDLCCLHVWYEIEVPITFVYHPNVRRYLTLNSNLSLTSKIMYSPLSAAHVHPTIKAQNTNRRSRYPCIVLKLFAINKVISCSILFLRSESNNQELLVPVVSTGASLLNPNLPHHPPNFGSWPRNSQTIRFPSPKPQILRSAYGNTRRLLIGRAMIYSGNRVSCGLVHGVFCKLTHLFIGNRSFDVIMVYAKK